MRNLKRALSLALASVMLMGMMVVGSSAAGYPDVDAQDNLEAIEVLQLLGVMSGDDKGNFNPDNDVTRNEMAVIMSHLLKLNLGGTHPFTDVPAWASPYVAACYANGITAGISDTTYGGNSAVTAVQGALMVMKALGYFQFQGEFKDSWTLAVVTQANKIGLFEGIDAAVTAPLSRSEAAQLCLNALESNVVVAEEEGGMSVDGNGISVSVNPTYTYTPVQRTADYRNDATDGIQQLCEKLYANQIKKDVSGTKTDDFGRPAAEWTYKGDSVTSPEAPDATYTAEVKAKAIYNDLGLTANLTGTSVTTYTDGIYNSATAKNIVKNDESTKWGGKGTLVEVYKIEDNTGAVTGAQVVVINTYLDEVASVDENSDDKMEVTLDQSGYTYETEAFDEEDMVIFTVARTAASTYEVKTMKLATVVEEVEVTRVTGTDSFVADGTKYEYNAAIDTYYSKLSGSNVKNVINVYLDDYGFVVGTTLYSGSSDYAYVIDTAKEGNWSTDATYKAKLLLADGTVAEVEIDANDSTYGNFKNKLVEYTVDSKNVYELTTVGTVPGSLATVDINKGEAKMTLGTTYYANAKTIFLLQKDSGKDASYTVYTGIANVPNLTGTGVTGAVYATGGMAKVVYLVDVTSSSETDELVYVLLNSVKYGKDSEVGEYYTYKAVVNGEITTIDFKHNDAPSTTGVVDSNVALYKSMNYNGDDLALASKCDAYDGDATKDEYVVAGAVSAKAEDGTIGVGGAYYTLSDDVVVYEVDNTDKEITRATINKAAVGENVEMVIQDGEVVAIFWLNH